MFKFMHELTFKREREIFDEMPRLKTIIYNRASLKESAVVVCELLCDSGTSNQIPSLIGRYILKIFIY